MDAFERFNQLYADIYQQGIQAGLSEEDAENGAELLANDLVYNEFGVQF